MQVGRWFQFRDRAATLTVECRAGFITFLMVSQHAASDCQSRSYGLRDSSGCRWHASRAKLLNVQGLRFTATKAHCAWNTPKGSLHQMRTSMSYPVSCLLVGICGTGRAPFRTHSCSPPLQICRVHFDLTCVVPTARLIVSLSCKQVASLSP